MPSSTAHQRWPCRMRSSVSGTPMSLLRLPAVASTASSPACERRIEASISFTVVLPFDPATATTAGRNPAPPRADAGGRKPPPPVPRERAEREARVFHHGGGQRQIARVPGINQGGGR